MRSSSSSLGLIRQAGSRIAGVSQTMRMQASSCCKRSNSAGVSGRCCALAISRRAAAVEARVRAGSDWGEIALQVESLIGMIRRVPGYQIEKEAA